MPQDPVAPPGGQVVQGVAQIDVVLRSALMAALALVKSHPEELDDALTAVRFDALTAEHYGDQDVQRARDWFLGVDVPVVSDLSSANPPPIALKVERVGRSEAEATLGDVHYDPVEFGDVQYVPLTTPFQPRGYDPSSGTLLLPDLPIAPEEGMLVVPSGGGAGVAVTSVIDDATVTLGPLPEGFDLDGAVLSLAQPRYARLVESIRQRETWRVTASCSGDPVYLLWLGVVVDFALLRYKEELLEARGFDQTTVSSGPAGLDGQFEGQMRFAREWSITGLARDVWGKDARERLRDVEVDLGVDTPAPPVVSDGSVDA